MSFRRAALIILLILIGAAAALFTSRSHSASVALLTASDAYAEATSSDAMAAMSDASSALYLTIHNTGGAPDTLLTVSTDAAKSATLHQTIVSNNIAQMVAIENGLPIPANSTVMLQPGGYHIMLEGLTRTLSAGDRITVQLAFRSGTTLTLTVPVKAF